MKWIESETPTIVINTSVDLTEVPIVKFYARGANKKIVEKNKADLTITSTTVSVTLTQADTILLGHGRCEINLKYVDSNGKAEVNKNKLIAYVSPMVKVEDLEK